MNDNRTEARLRALLAPPDEFPDAHFTARVRRAILAEEAMRAARRRAWRRFAVELFGTAAIVLAFFVMGRGDAGAGGEGFNLGPAVAGFTLLGFWTFAALRPGARGRG
jgi:hypothetical protein